MKQFNKIIGKAGSIRLAVALVVGLGLGVLAGKVGAVPNLVPYLLFPILVGLVGAFTVGTKNLRFHLVALATGLVGWVGISIYLSVLGARMASGSCAGGTCGTMSVLMDLLALYLAAGFVLVALSSLITSTVLRYYRVGRSERF